LVKTFLKQASLEIARGCRSLVRRRDPALAPRIERLRAAREPRLSLRVKREIFKQADRLTREAPVNLGELRVWHKNIRLV
jgi:hypothetical protein